MPLIELSAQMFVLSYLITFLVYLLYLTRNILQCSTEHEFNLAV